MIKISAILSLVAACSAIPVPQQYFTIAQQPQFTLGQQNGLTFGQPQYYTLGQGSGLQYVNGGAFGGQTILVAAAPAPAVRQVVVRPAPVPAPAPVVVVKAAPAPPAPEPTAYPQYSYSYKVDDAESGDHKEASETRDGDSVSGKYSLVEPDGTLRTVTYTADKDNGFQATVQRDAPAAPVQPIIVKAAPAPAPVPVKRIAIAQPAPAVQYVTLQQAPAFQTVQYPQVQTIQVAQAPAPAIVKSGPVAQVSVSSPNGEYSYVH